MIAVFVNCIFVVAGSLVGVLFSKKLSAAMAGVISTAAGLVTLVVGIQMALGFSNVIYLALSLILGGIFGSILDIDKRIFDFGRWLEKLISKNKTQSGTPSAQNQTQNKNFAKAFLSGSVLFCVGAMAILGSLQAGIQKDYTLIFTKSVLDAFMAMVFAAAMGIGTAFSAISIFAYQGLLTLLASAIAPFMTEKMLGEISAAGGVLIVMISIGLIDIRQIKTANYLPALVFIALFVIADPYIAKIIPL